MRKYYSQVLYIVFVALLAVVTMDVIFQLRILIMGFDLSRNEYYRLLEMLDILGIFEKVFIVILLGLVIFRSQDFRS